MRQHYQPRRGESLAHRPSRTVAYVVSLLLILCTAIGAVAAAPGAEAGASPDGRITLTKTANPTSLPVSGGSVTYTYTVKNTTGADMYYRSIADDKCANPTYQSGMRYYFDWYYYRYVYYLEPGYTATWTCTQTVSQTTTNTATTTFAYGTYGGATSTATAQATVNVGSPASTWCGGIYFGTAHWSTSFVGSIGQWTPGSAPVTLRNIPASGNTLFDQTNAVAVSATDPGYVYYGAQQDFDPTSTSETGGIYKVSTASTTSAPILVVGSSAATVTNRLAFDANGTLWSFAVGGHLYSLAKGSQTWVDRGIPTGTDGTAFNNVGYGDIAFDGLGNMWVLGGSQTLGTRLYTISATELSKTTGISATYVGQTGAANYYWYGLAFGPDGTLYASYDPSSGGTVSTTASGSIWSINTATGAPTKIVENSVLNQTQDMASCALPKPELLAQKAVSPTGVVKPGDTVTYTITVKNIGNLTATGVTFQDPIPTGTTYVRGSTKLNGEAVADVTSPYFPYSERRPINSPGAFAGTIAPGATATITFQTTVQAGQTQVCNQGSVFFTGGKDLIYTDDPNAPGGTDKTCTTVLTPKIAVDKQADTRELSTNPQTVTYTYDVRTAAYRPSDKEDPEGVPDPSYVDPLPGTEPLKPVTVTDDKCSPVEPILKADGITNVGDTNSDGILQPVTYDAAKGSWVGETWKFKCTTTLTQATMNTATATGTGVTTKTVVTDKDTWTVNNPPLTIVKTSDTSEAGTVLNPGDTITYTVTVKNTGTTDRTNVTLTDTLPDGVTYVAGSAQKTYPKDVTTGQEMTGTTTTWAAGGDFDSSLTQTIPAPTNLPAGAQITGYSVSMSGTTNYYYYYGQQSDLSVSAKYGSTLLFDIDRGTDSDDNEFGIARSGAWGPLDRSGAVPTTQAQPLTLTWYDFSNASLVTDQTINKTTVTWAYKYTSQTTTRGLFTDAASAPPAMVTTADAITLKPGEALTVTFKATVDGDAPAELINRATADSDLKKPISDDVTDKVKTPSLDVAKSPGALTGPDAAGNYTASYQVTVKNTGAATGTYGPLIDTVAFDADVTPTAIAWIGHTTGSQTFTAAPYAAQLAGETTIAAGATHTYDVTVTFQRTGTGAVGECTGEPGNGLYNSVDIPQAETDDANNDACVPPAAQFKVQKAAEGGEPGGTGPSVRVADNGTVTVSYTVTVTNTGLATAVHPAITDTATLPQGFTLTSVTVGGATQTPVSATFTIQGASLAPGATTTYTVVVVATAPDLNADDWTKAGTCDTSGGGTPAAGGFFNLVAMTDDADGPDNNDACVPVEPPIKVIHVVKQGLNCDVGQPTCALPGATFDLYKTDPTTPGATPIAGGLTAGAEGSYFTSVPLPIQETYWIVETKAPAGFNLLPQPIRFTLGASGITLAEPGALVTLKTGDTFTIVISNASTAPLPEAGGEGPLPFYVMGLLLLIAGGYYHLKTSGSRLAPSKVRP